LSEWLTFTEKDFQAAVREYAELHGWTVFSTWNSRHSPNGEPDLRMVRPPRVIFAELKSAKGKLSAAQAHVIDLLRLCDGVETYIWRPGEWPLIEGILE
jgi:hypothetical protein